ncbi:DUF5131 family protein [Streptomyces muensis]|uniref:Phage Gp37/Gp68 family protein n=1 Tax=Streptomyces muensis TaxID=1077944 RepID=A0A9X1PRZ9_STRM4|nr:DUF5131 family protein [Streptomyces muensis]MCF1592440.1 phage Gp37/Gp68 family protein [Streptomyces muensis]
MSTNTAIEWANKTWGPIIGCTRVSSGCDGCYAIRTANIRTYNPNPKIAAAYAGTVHTTDGRLDWTGQVNLVEDRLTDPLRWRKPLRVFVNSQSDLFHEQVPEEFIARIFAVIAVTPRHTYQVLTKRHGRMRSLLGKREFWQEVGRHARQDAYRHRGAEEWIEEGVSVCDPASFDQLRQLPNLWLGVSVEDQKTADMRIPALLETPAAVRWISAEPLLGPIDLCGPVHPDGGRRKLTYWLDGRPGLGEGYTTGTGLVMHPLVTGPRLDWVVAGGESGPGARPAHPDWFRLLRDQCAHSGVRYWFKQWGQWGLEAPLDGEGRIVRGARGQGVTLANDGTVYAPGDLAYPDGPRYGEAIRAGHQRANLTQLYSIGKKAAGHELDGRVHQEFPEARPAAARAEAGR